MKDFDIVIIGKTIAGLALACGLSKNLEIAILDDCSFDKHLNDNTLELINMSMISHASSRLLRYLEIWDNDIINHASPYSSINISEENSFKNFIFKNSCLGYPCLGYIIDNTILYKTLLHRASEFKNICFMDDIRLSRLIDKKDLISVTINDRENLLTKLLIITNGVYQGSFLYQTLDISLIFWGYPYYILVGTLVSEYLHSNIVHYFFQKENILILLPLIESHYSFVFWLLYSHSSKYVLDNFNKKSWDDLFVRSFNKLGVISFQEDLRFIPCVFQYVQNFSTNRSLLLGTASHDISFLKYQNVNRDLMDVAILLERINKCKNFYEDDILRNPEYLYSYEQNRRCAAIKIFSKEQFIRSCFYGNNIMKKYVRGAIFQMMQRSSCLITKFDFINNLMGFDDIPDWLLTDYFD